MSVSKTHCQHWRIEKFLNLLEPISLHLGLVYVKFLGCQYVMGAVSPYLAIYYDVSKGKAQLLLPLVWITNIFVMPIGGQLASRMDPKK